LGRLGAEADRLIAQHDDDIEAIVDRLAMAGKLA